MFSPQSAPFALAAPAATRTAAAGALIRWQNALAAVVEQLMIWHERTLQRRQLQSLSDHMLRDIGIGRADVEAESSKPFWRP